MGRTGRATWLWALGLASGLIELRAEPPRLVSETRRERLADGSTLELEAGELSVPESRRRPTARRVTIPYYRLKSTSPSPAAPIFLLAGGPGSSWLDQFEVEETRREALFYRGLADVVLFDQRGGGRSRPALACDESVPLAADRPLDHAALGEALRAAASACRDRWQAAGVDLAAYNTVENAADVDELRRALGYDKVTLIGGSYGSHLALAIMRTYPTSVERAVLYGVEGPDHTWDDPAAILATLARIAADAEASPALHGRVPPGGLLAALERAIARLEAAPRTVTVEADGVPTPVLVDADTLRRLARAGAGRRKSPLAWPEMILALDRGELGFAAERRLDNRRLPVAPPMHYSMDCASGASAERRRRYDAAPAAKLLGDLNFEYRVVCDVWPSENLGDAFRAPLVSDIPTLIVHGTWDLSTPIENAREVAAGLRRGQLVEVVGGGHGALYSLYQRWPPMTERLRAFLTGRPAAFPASVDDRPLAAAAAAASRP